MHSTTERLAALGLPQKPKPSNQLPLGDKERFFSIKPLFCPDAALPRCYQDLAPLLSSTSNECGTIKQEVRSSSLASRTTAQAFTVQACRSNELRLQQPTQLRRLERNTQVDLVKQVEPATFEWLMKLV